MLPAVAVCIAGEDSGDGTWLTTTVTFDRDSPLPAFSAIPSMDAGATGACGPAFCGGAAIRGGPGTGGAGICVNNKSSAHADKVISTSKDAPY